MDYSLLTYNFKRYINLGDYIQSLAARQFLPKIDRYIDRERLDEYRGPATKVIMNGWFMRHPEKWPPCPQIIPLFISFHMNLRRADGMLTEDGLTYFRKYQPIGCRDINTQKLLEDRGIRTYFSNCLTLTFGRSYRHNANEDIYLVDILPRYPTTKSVFQSFNSFFKSIGNGEILRLGRREKLIRRIIGDSIIQSAKEITHIYPADEFATEQSRFELADKILKCYEKAKLVITSRIHCALPCTAMGTPVIFINGGFKQTQASRFSGITELFHTVNVSADGSIETNFDLRAVQKTGKLEAKTDHLKYLEVLNKQCETFVNVAT